METSYIKLVTPKDASVRLAGTDPRKLTFFSQKIISLVGDDDQNSPVPIDWNWEKMGIGGLKAEFSDIFRRAFASRVFPVSIIKKLGIKHVKGMLLYGPPGTGKTLMARQIGKMLNGK
jgi:hypothetical protein